MGPRPPRSGFVQGLQNALWALGGVFAVARHDNLSAATRDLKQGQGRSLTKRFEEHAAVAMFELGSTEPG